MDLGVIRVSLNDRFFRIAKDFQLQRVNNRKSNLVLNVEDIFEDAIVSLRPQLVSANGINELGRDSESIT